MTIFNSREVGDNFHMKGVGMLVGNFELHRKETNLGVAQVLFDP